MEGEEEEEEGDKREGGEEEKMKSSLRKRAMADVAWMKSVIEEQIQLEREREGGIDNLHWWVLRFWLASPESAPR